MTWDLYTFCKQPNFKISLVFEISFANRIRKKGFLHRKQVVGCFFLGFFKLSRCRIDVIRMCTWQNLYLEKANISKRAKLEGTFEAPFSSFFR